MSHKKFIKERSNVLLNIFLIVSIIGGIITNIISYFVKVVIPNNIGFLTGFVMFFFSVICLKNFKKHKLSRLTFVLPIFNITLFLILITVGIVLGVLLNLSIIQEIPSLDLIITFNFFYNLFEVFFAGYLLYRFRNG